MNDQKDELEGVTTSESEIEQNAITNEEVVDLTANNVEDYNEEDEEVIDDEDNSVSNENVFYSQPETEASEDVQTDKSSISDNRMDAHSSVVKKPRKKETMFVLILLIVIVGIVLTFNFSSSNEKDNEKDASKTEYSLNKQDKEKVSDIASRVSSFYEDSKRTKLKKNIDKSKLKDLKKDIDSVSDKTLRTEFLRLYDKLETDIKDSTSN